MTTSTELARAVVGHLVENGVREIVLAPGSRNAPLAFAAFDAAEAGLVRLHTRIDERSAGFLALGLTKQRSSAAVICTSGTAVANLHPAMLEAVHAGVPLIAVTADRPARLRGTNANQTTDQVGIFGPLVHTVDVTGGTYPDPETRLGGPQAPVGAPVHLNVCLDDPLTPAERWRPELEVGATWASLAEPLGLTKIPHGPRTVVVAGDDSGRRARQLAERAGWPLFAEPSSGSRTGTHALRCYRLLLDGELGAQVERAVVFGHPTLSRPVSRLLARTDVEVWARPSGVWGALPVAADQEFAHLDVDESADTAWLDAWLSADRHVGRRLDALLAAEPRLTPYDVAGAVAGALPPGGLLVVGSSSPIRDLDLMVPRYEVGARRKVIANRGLSGIDGVVSTAVGAALVRDSARSLALLGDVTFLHDANGLVIGPDEPRPDLTLVVANDDGGSIFATLEQGAEEYADRFDRLFGTPHGVDLASLCAATRTPHLRVTSRVELEHALASPNGGIEVVEAVVGREDRRALDARIRALADAL
ncbi:MAG TPA: 2-succinyl-5-enolpyruvyl-6-hydroxy-3-cyclohexene-1-carboxylic-acid synthase [Nocardioides sp.]|uniref:2-succinyl-5-enolpyruvyl-6-hydroxy-3- cyclohexene-1-carboxylic-acid synthase n=1 Tax=Nocardioides sp. TaxID=35761 RepID=UPI002E2EB6E6|nr:2-succinyl-5-enolpyruvyl-6-hydroxy-3-cyclohexene-1-carboxylic-acid synthase [Nocardioides sp.]HEX3933009.1 2-succinyl-5-enolpyruvyl-6-hydroxy-3-cyclohexene-1-carboxylic-acid synthase [Nocardioides sp.]